MNEGDIRDRLARAHRLLADLRSAARPDIEAAADGIMRLFDPKGPFNTPTAKLKLAPTLQLTVLRIREIMEQFRDGNRESIEQALRDLWIVLDRPDVLAALRPEEEAAAERK
jgi:hypothetical protein